jgi:methyl-accepting chemotaxis protein
MTSHEKWREVGLGESGETYLVGSDHKARSISRFLVEDPSGYQQTLIQQGTDTALAKEITTKGSNIGLQSIDTKAVQLALNGQSGVQSIQDYRSVNVLSAYTPLEIEDLNWVLLSEIDEEEAFAATGELQWNIIITSLVSVAVFTALGLMLSGWFANSISRPIESLAATMRHIATNHDLTLRSDIARTDEIGDMANSVNTMLVGFQTLVQRILTATVNVAAATEQLSSVSATTQDGINTQRSETEQVATAMHEMVATVAEIARNTAEAASAAEETDQQAQAGKASIERTARTLSELNDAMHSSSNVIEQLHQDSDKIGQVLEVISAIAEQTNLLALNAAIEAARAGEQGRGFAVVADEVRTLAARTQNSTEEINQIIAGLQSRAKQAVESMQHSRSKTSDTIDQAEETRSTLEQITVAVNQITEMSLQIASAAEEQNSVAEEINRNIVAISEVSELTAHGSEQTATASQELARLGADLHHLASEFKA